jgi:hypothetical protein
MKKSYLYSILVPLILWVLGEVFVFEPNFFFISISLGVLLLALFIRSIIKKHKSKFWPIFVLTPALFYLSFSFYSTIIVGQFWIQTIFLLIAWFLFSYLQNLYFYFSFGASEREEKLNRLLLIGSFLSAFAIAATLYALPIFLSWPDSLLLLVFAAISIIIFGQFFVFSKGIDKERKIFWLIDVIILTEFAGILFLFPLNYNVLGLLLAIIFYLLILFDEWRLNDRLVWKNVKWPVIISALIIIIILLSARWL